MVDSVMRKWAEAKNLPEVGGAIVSVGTGGLDMSYGHFPDLNGWAASVAIDESTWNKDMLKELKRMAKGIGTAVYRDGALLIVIRATSLNGKFSKLEQAGDLLRTALPQLGIQPMQYCRYCRTGGCDDSVVSNGSAFPAHAACKQQQAQKILSEVEDNRQNGNIVLAILASLVGVVVGCIPSFLTIYFMDLLSGWLFILLPLGAYYGYKLAKGVMAQWLVVLISVVSFVGAGFLTVFGTYIIFLREFGAMSLGDFLEFYRMALPYLDASDLFSEFGVPVLFTILGIALAWGQIRQGNKQKLQEAEALQQSLGTSQAAAARPMAQTPPMQQAPPMAQTPPAAPAPEQSPEKPSV